MALGGYKFAGRYCNRGTLTDVQWALLMHKTKVAAFMAANTAANAGWAYHMTGSPDGNYHCLDSVGNNYVTCFYNSATDRYFAIYTLCYHTYSGTDSGMVKVLLSSHDGFVNPSGTIHYAGVYASNFFRYGQIEIAYNTALDVVTPYISRLIPAGNLGLKTTNEGSSGYGKTNTLFAESSAMFGYAIKADNIIMFSGKYNASQIKANLCVSAVSGHAFSHLTSATDVGTGALYNTQGSSSTVSNTYENAARLAPVNSLFSPVSQVTMYNGRPTNTSGLAVSPYSYIRGSTNIYPYQAVVAYNVENDTNVTGKGMFNIDLISVAFYAASQQLCPSLCSASADGNFLCVRLAGTSVSDAGRGISFSQGINSAFTHTYDVAIFVGWDASNPDITQSSAWSEYTG